MNEPNTPVAATPPSPPSNPPGAALLTGKIEGGSTGNAPALLQSLLDATDPWGGAAGLHGEFAAGLASADGQGGVLLTDRFATHSLCWRVIAGRVHFAARADELAALPPCAEIDPQAIFDYFYFHVIPSPRTIFRGVYRLEPGVLARIRGDRLEQRRWWNPRFTEPASADFDKLAAQFRALVEDAVRTRLDGSKPACFLSGGTDSSTVAGMIGKVLGRAGSTYSIGFEAEGYDEMQYARIAAKRFGTDHHEYYVTPEDLVSGIPLVAASYDQPFGNSSVVPAYYCAKMAREDGVSLLIAGDGGDEFFGGNVRYAKQRLFGFYEQVPGVVRKGLLEPILQGTPVGALPLARKGRSYIEQARVPLPDRMQMYNLLQRLGQENVFERGFLAQIDAEDPLRQQRAVWKEAGQASPLNLMLAYDWRYTLTEADLRKVRGSTELADVQTRFPFLDHRLVDFSLDLPVSYKLKGDKLRWFFKEALRGFLPDEILAKKKQGFGLPFGVWANRHDGLKRFATDSLQSLARRGIVRADFIDTLLNEHLPAHPGYYGEMVWISMILEQWLRRHAPGWRLR
ncbi:MAG TPA: asparagine synthase C-terminal domain-containing protein [Rubrivivax sp.]|nr:asparagine synthase C-terminal domain-containing protein [Rubrivivax sp.]